MTIKERLKQPYGPYPACIFVAMNPNGEEVLLCTDSFLFGSAGLLAEHPDIMEWEVTKERFTQEELDARKAPNDPKLSDCGARRDPCAAGGKAVAE